MNIKIRATKNYKNTHFMKSGINEIIFKIIQSLEIVTQTGGEAGKQCIIFYLWRLGVNFR